MWSTVDILTFSINFCQIKIDLSGNTVLTTSLIYPKTRQNGPFLAFFDKLLSAQNVNVARFARHVE